MKQVLSGLLAGTIFGIGLAVSGMTDPNKVLAFLTLDANWDPALLLVIGSAVITTAIGYALVNRRVAPLFDVSFHRPEKTTLDGRLLGGAAIFGVGWGVAGFCPGPAIVAALTLDSRAWVFLPAFVVGMVVHERFLLPRTAPQS
jgi:uncharacterized membrane protein YedE/YeeE